MLSKPAQINLFNFDVKDDDTIIQLYEVLENWLDYMINLKVQETPFDSLPHYSLVQTMFNY
jgi:hypothetical protein